MIASNKRTGAFVSSNRNPSSSSTMSALPMMPIAAATSFRTKNAGSHGQLVISGTTRHVSCSREKPPSTVIAASKFTDIMRPRADSSSNGKRSYGVAPAPDSALSVVGAGIALEAAAVDADGSGVLSSMHEIAMATCSKSSLRTASRASRPKLYGVSGTSLSRAIPISTKSACRTSSAVLCEPSSF